MSCVCKLLRVSALTSAKMHAWAGKLTCIQIVLSSDYLGRARPGELNSAGSVGLSLPNKSSYFWAIPWDSEQMNGCTFSVLKKLFLIGSYRAACDVSWV